MPEHAGAFHDSKLGTGSSFPSPPEQRGKWQPRFWSPSKPIRLSPTLTADELPAGFDEILDVQVLGYRERLTSLAVAAASGCSISVDAYSQVRGRGLQSGQNAPVSQIFDSAR